MGARGTDPGRDGLGTIAAELGAAGFVDAVEIGRGASGVVYRCLQVALERPVAVKVLTAAVADDPARFAREQQALGRLMGHPNIVAVLEFGQTPGGRPFFVMPLHQRRSLAERLGRLPVDEVLRVGVKIAGALASAHRSGVVHGDVKPANILLTDYGEPALSDFGMPRAEADPSGCTAPELVGAEPPSAASDVYSLGASLSAVLTVDPQVRGDVASMIAAATAPRPGDRPSATELGELIQRLQAAHGSVVDEMTLAGGEAPAGRRRASEFDATRAATAASRFPAAPGGLVGRTAELRQLRSTLGTSRLVTVTGVGGIGKTTLATAAAAALRVEFSGEVWLVDLTELTEGALLVEGLAAAVGIRAGPGKPLAEVLIDVLAPVRALLVLDSCEHLIDDVADLVDTLLRGCPTLHILATSREVLDLRDEAVVSLAPLGCPAPEDTLRRLAEREAVALFVRRARAATPEFALSERNAVAVARICTRLEGLPLAIELAAARMRAMSPDEIANTLEGGYALLTRRRRGALTRKQSLWSSVAWSYDLCTPNEQRLWSRLSVFVGNFEPRAASVVCTAEHGDDGLSAGEFFDVLGGLVDKSILIRTAQHDGPVRFRLLEPLRDYGRERATDTERARLQRRHREYYRQLVAGAAPEWFGRNDIEWLQRIACEMPNVREALRNALADSPETALQMTTDMFQVWLSNGTLGEGRRWQDRALKATPAEPGAQRIQALFIAGGLACLHGDLHAARTYIAEARTHLPHIQAAHLHGRIECIDAYVGLLSGEFESAGNCSRRAMAITDDDESHFLSSVVLGWVLLLDGDTQEATRSLEKALAICQSRGDSVWRLHALVAVGVCRLRQGDPSGARKPLREGLQLCRLIHDPLNGAQFLATLGWTEVDQDPRRAVTLIAAAFAVAQNYAAPVFAFPVMSGLHVDTERRLRERLGSAAYEAAIAEGNELGFEEAVILALAG